MKKEELKSLDDSVVIFPKQFVFGSFVRIEDAERYARQAVKHALDVAAEKATCHYEYWGDGDHDKDYKVTEHSITDCEKQILKDLGIC